MRNLITEQFLSIQGEGRSLGKTAYFIRFAGCNLRCAWCDSMHSVDPREFRDKTFPIDYALVPKQCDLVILTGGEPTLFDLQEVRLRLGEDNPKRVFEVESNATRFPAQIADNFVWNLSPKLKSSAQMTHHMDAERLRHLGEWTDYSRSRSNVTYKFVVKDANDFDEVERLVLQHSIPHPQVYIMGEGSTRESQSLEQVAWIVERCKQSGFAFSPRLHILFWGDRRGV